MIFFVISSTAFAEDKPKVIRVTGTGCPPSNWNQQDNFAKTYARQAARIDALRCLAEIFSDVKHFIIKSHSVVEDGIVMEDVIKTELKHDSKVFKVIKKNARQIGETKFSFGDDGKLYCELEMEIILPADWKK
jgi:hypothetical protein